MRGLELDLKQYLFNSMAQNTIRTMYIYIVCMPDVVSYRNGDVSSRYQKSEACVNELTSLPTVVTEVRDVAYSSLKDV